ncbi:hypothetical protein [Ancylobacter amanitiformis]|uniref:ASCH domain-containing protein n=1 Tax=Ancylobacter amanitiformis TaxID=217069 RepID=A0ABU0LQJ8_9HYPH|nr:hypothetical protein [Ancylobacter amanitiformis]MDQ0510946.1 hypothetical protein [Ancylobacter amanitiformis]
MTGAIVKALTVWQPWASLIILGFKPYEFRGWPAPISLRGKRVAIHAGARPVRATEVADLIVRLKGDDAWTTCLKPEALEFLERVKLTPGILPRSHILGTAVLGAPMRSYEIVGEFGGTINDSDRDEHCNWAWPVSEIEQIKPPVPAKGAQGFWDWRP